YPLALEIFGENGDGLVPFKPVPLEVPANAPDGRLTVRGVGIPGVPSPNVFAGWEATFDASHSTGDGLSFVIDFGDGEYASGPVAQDALRDKGTHRARAIVVDRFGRVDPDTLTFEVGTVCNLLIDSVSEPTGHVIGW